MLTFTSVNNPSDQDLFIDPQVGIFIEERLTASEYARNSYWARNVWFDRLKDRMILNTFQIEYFIKDREPLRWLHHKKQNEGNELK